MRHPTASQPSGHPRSQPLQATTPAGDSPVRTLPSTELLQGCRSVEINHNGAVYRLQATKLGKLILTK